MLTYISLYQWTDQGIKSVKDTVTRAEQNVKLFEEAGARNVQVFWTQGQYDLIAISEWPDEETATAFALGLGRTGNIRSVTMRAFTSAEMTRILAKLP